MNKLSNNQKGFSVGQVLLVVLVLGLIGGIGYYVYQRQNKTKITTFEECKAAGNPIMESYPEQCSADGKTFTNTAQKVVVEDNSSTEESSKAEQKFLEIKEIDAKIPLSSEISGAYYNVRSSTGGSSDQWIDLSDTGFEQQKNIDGKYCKDFNDTLFAIGRISLADFKAKLTEGFEASTATFPFESKALSFNTDYRYAGRPSSGAPPGCAMYGSEMQDLDEKVLEVWVTKKKAFAEAYKNMQDL